jgi:hypothetical protein
LYTARANHTLITSLGLENMLSVVRVEAFFSVMSYWYIS